MRLKIGQRMSNNAGVKKGGPMLAVGYSRVSSEEQVANYSLETQKEEIGKAAKQLGYKILQIFSDPGRSGKDMNRPGLREMLSLVEKNGDVTALFIYQISRLSRDTLDYLLIKKELAKNGVRIISTTEPMESSPVGEFSELVMAGVARLDNAMKSQRTLDGIRKRLEDGWHSGLAPMGYKNVEKGGKNVIVPDEYFLHCQSAWLRFKSGLYTPTDMTKYLQERNVKVRWGSRLRPVTEKQVWRMFRNKFYVGLIEHKHFGIFQGKHEAMVGMSVFNKVQEILDGRSITHTSPKKYLSDSFPLRQFIKCPDCGRAMTGAYSKGRGGKYPYYFCPVHRKSIKRRLAHQKIIKLLRRIKPTEAFMKIFVAQLKEKWGKERQVLKQAEETMEKELKAYETAKKRIYLKHMQGEYTDEEFKEAKSLLQVELLPRRVSKHDHQFEGLDIDIICNFMIALCTNLDKAWSMGVLQQRQAIQGLIFPEGMVYANLKNRTPKIAPCFNLIVGKKHPQWTFGVADGNRTRNIRLHRAMLCR